CDAIGLDATMYAYARTGRGAAITDGYDIPTARHVYGGPDGTEPTATPRPTATPTLTPRPTPSLTPTVAPAPTPSPTPFPDPGRCVVEFSMPANATRQAPGVYVDCWPVPKGYNGKGVKVCAGGRCTARLSGAA